MSKLNFKPMRKMMKKMMKKVPKWLKKKIAVAVLTSALTLLGVSNNNRFDPPTPPAGQSITVVNIVIHS